LRVGRWVEAAAAAGGGVYREYEYVARKLAPLLDP
jgi:hypothetical protein